MSSKTRHLSQTDVSRFAAANLIPQPDVPGYAELIDSLAAGDKARSEFLKACLRKLGLEISENESGVPSLSSLHLSSINNIEVDEQLAVLGDIIEKEDGEEWIRGETDTFHIQKQETVWKLDSLQQSLPQTDASTNGLGGAKNHSTIVKEIVPHTKEVPPPKLTPQFNHGTYYSSLRRYQQEEKDAEAWGNLLMYGEVVTSTNTLLEKYLSRLS